MIERPTEILSGVFWVVYFRAIFSQHRAEGEKGVQYLKMKKGCSPDLRATFNILVEFLHFSSMFVKHLLKDLRLLIH